ncbi:MAG TPA: hypothetical protein DD490_00255 [Acidobacteria bacterium]|nr:hypothetical protein [Acidobacteriota bacterium]
MRLRPASGLEAIAAAASVDILHRDELFWALHAVLVKRPEDFALYEQAFGLFCFPGLKGLESIALG